MIKIDMPMPKSCRECKLYRYNEINDMGANITYYDCALDAIPFEDYRNGIIYKTKRHDNCPLIKD